MIKQSKERPNKAVKDIEVACSHEAHIRRISRMRKLWSTFTCGPIVWDRTWSWTLFVYFYTRLNKTECDGNTRAWLDFCGAVRLWWRSRLAHTPPVSLATPNVLAFFIAVGSRYDAPFYFGRLLNVYSLTTTFFCCFSSAIHAKYIIN